MKNQEFNIKSKTKKDKSKIGLETYKSQLEIFKFQVNKLINELEIDQEAAENLIERKENIFNEVTKNLKYGLVMTAIGNLIMAPNLTYFLDAIKYNKSIFDYNTTYPNIFGELFSWYTIPISFILIGISMIHFFLGIRASIDYLKLKKN
jgi:hypothetical protein